VEQQLRISQKRAKTTAKLLSVIMASFFLLNLIPTTTKGGLPDTDGDGLSDTYENSNGLDPNNPDTDGDGLLDGWVDDGKDQNGNAQAGLFSGNAIWDFLDYGKDGQAATFDEGEGDVQFTTGEPFTDTNRNGIWDTGEDYEDTDNDNEYDPGESCERFGEVGDPDRNNWGGFGTNANNPDSDGDGIWDGWHDDNGDSLWNSGEIIGEAGTRWPHSSDYTTISDYYTTGTFGEKGFGTDPLSQDTDADGLLDEQETTNCYTHYSQTDLELYVPTRAVGGAFCDILIKPLVFDWYELVIFPIELSGASETLEITISGYYYETDPVTYEIIFEEDDHEYWSGSVFIETVGVEYRVLANGVGSSFADDVHIVQETYGEQIRFNFKIEGKTSPRNPDTDGDLLEDGFGEDCDFDGVTSAAETNPILCDSDNDGLNDGNEDTNKNNIFEPSLGETDPLEYDTDHDGLSDLEERYSYGSDPNKLDSDDDGLRDNHEVDYNTAPLIEDTDGDGLWDGAEVDGIWAGFTVHEKTGEQVYGEPFITDPAKADTDGDGLYDGWRDDGYDQFGNLHDGTGGTTNWIGNWIWDYEDLDASTLYTQAEDYDDIGSDGLADIDEPGYDSETNPDPSGDNFDLLLNPTGTEGNNEHDDGEPYIDLNGNSQYDASWAEPCEQGGELGHDSRAESTSKTNPTKKDTDGDGLADGDEVFVYFTFASAYDGDWDGLSDKEELFTYFTNPTHEDTDGDGLKDGWDDTDDSYIGDGPATYEWNYNGQWDYDDVNTNGLYDPGEPFGDFGADGLSDRFEPGYHPVNNPDPSDDNYDTFDKPEGTERNGEYDDGEPYGDIGVDGIENSKEDGYDPGDPNSDPSGDNYDPSTGTGTEGNGQYDEGEPCQKWGEIGDISITSGSNGGYGTLVLDPDTDDDYLSDGDEVSHHADPFIPDTDDDTLLDGYEVHGYNEMNYPSEPDLVDSDGDGLDDDEELFVYFTNPLYKDTDGDRLEDNDELTVYDTKPTVYDPNFDGVVILQEHTYSGGTITTPGISLVNSYAVSDEDPEYNHRPVDFLRPNYDAGDSLDHELILDSGEPVASVTHDFDGDGLDELAILHIGHIANYEGEQQGLYLSTYDVVFQELLLVDVQRIADQGDLAPASPRISMNALNMLPGADCEVVVAYDASSAEPWVHFKVIGVSSTLEIDDGVITPISVGKEEGGDLLDDGTSGERVQGIELLTGNFIDGNQGEDELVVAFSVVRGSDYRLLFSAYEYTTDISHVDSMTFNLYDSSRNFASDTSHDADIAYDRFVTAYFAIDGGDDGPTLRKLEINALNEIVSVDNQNCNNARGTWYDREDYPMALCAGNFVPTYSDWSGDWHTGDEFALLTFSSSNGRIETFENNVERVFYFQQKDLENNVQNERFSLERGAANGDETDELILVYEYEDAGSETWMKMRTYEVIYDPEGDPWTREYTTLDAGTTQVVPSGEQISLAVGYFGPSRKDSDEDGLHDARELVCWTDPLDPTKPDTDNDGDDDFYEVLIAGNPLSADEDNDGLRSDFEKEIIQPHEDPGEPDADAYKLDASKPGLAFTDEETPTWTSDIVTLYDDYILTICEKDGDDIVYEEGDKPAPIGIYFVDETYSVSRGPYHAEASLSSFMDGLGLPGWLTEIIDFGGEGSLGFDAELEVKIGFEVTAVAQLLFQVSHESWSPVDWVAGETMPFLSKVDLHKFELDLDFYLQPVFEIALSGGVYGGVRVFIECDAINWKVDEKIGNPSGTNPLPEWSFDVGTGGNLFENVGLDRRGSESLKMGIGDGVNAEVYKYLGDFLNPLGRLYETNNIRAEFELASPFNFDFDFDDVKMTLATGLTADAAIQGKVLGVVKDTLKAKIESIAYEKSYNIDHLFPGEIVETEIEIPTSGTLGQDRVMEFTAEDFKYAIDAGVEYSYDVRPQVDFSLVIDLPEIPEKRISVEIDTGDYTFGYIDYKVGHSYTFEGYEPDDITWTRTLKDFLGSTMNYFTSDGRQWYELYSMPLLEPSGVTLDLGSSTIHHTARTEELTFSNDDIVPEWNLDVINQIQNELGFDSNIFGSLLGLDVHIDPKVQLTNLKTDVLVAENTGDPYYENTNHGNYKHTLEIIDMPELSSNTATLNFVDLDMNVNIYIDLSSSELEDALTVDNPLHGLTGPVAETLGIDLGEIGEAEICLLDALEVFEFYDSENKRIPIYSWNIDELANPDGEDSWGKLQAEITCFNENYGDIEIPTAIPGLFFVISTEIILANSLAIDQTFFSCPGSWETSPIFEVSVLFSLKVGKDVGPISFSVYVDIAELNMRVYLEGFGSLTGSFYNEGGQLSGIKGLSTFDVSETGSSTSVSLYRQVNYESGDHDDIDSYTPKHDDLIGYLEDIQYQVTELRLQVEASGYMYYHNGYHGITVGNYLWKFVNEGSNDPTNRITNVDFDTTNEVTGREITVDFLN